MASPFLICEFAKATLSNLVKESFGSDFPDINTKKQVNYLFNYLKDLGAQTILLESEYIDKDYLEDYSRYYVKCFNRYGERCARLHFFSHEFDHSKFSKAFDGQQQIINSLQENYLGFIVVKPLPKTFIGKTCLKLYDRFDSTNSKTQENRKVIKRTYAANLFGIELTIDTVAFQEQDKVISACATTAVWSALQALDHNDTRTVPSSSEITLAAINHIENSSNSFPNEGLTNKQILRALDIQGFRNHYLDLTQVNDNSLPKIMRLIKSYITSNLPVILGANVFAIPQSNKDTKKLTYLADHAVTVLGYKQDKQETVLYLHDDRLGPFARAKVTPINELLPNLDPDKRISTKNCICLQEKNDEGKWQSAQQILIPDSLIIPNYKKVRIPAEFIDNTCQSIVEDFESFYQNFSTQNESVLKTSTPQLPQLTYQIQLQNSSAIKSRLILDTKVNNKTQFLTQSTARFLWSAKFYLNTELSLEILFDSTDIPQGNAVVYLLEYNPKNCIAILAYYQKLIASKKRLPQSNKENFLSALILALKPKEPDAFTYLDKQYGEPRAPKRLKKEEVTNSQLQTQSNIKKRYGREQCCLNKAFPNQQADGSFLIWAISLDGALLIGEEVGNKGHPTLTGFKPARIAGELRKTNNGWFINAKSGRYSRDYENVEALLNNAKEKFLEVFNEHDPQELEIKLFTTNCSE